MGAPRAARSAPPRRAGFTLIELMTVVIIIGLVGGVAVVSWQAMLPKQRFNTAIRDLSEVLHSTRSEAISRNREFQIHYDLDAESYRVRTPWRPGGGFALYEEDEHVWMNETDLEKAGITIEQVTVDGEVFSDGKVFVRFDPLGASSAHSVVIKLELFDLLFTIEVLPLTGQIRFHEGLYERDEAEEADFR